MTAATAITCSSTKCIRCDPSTVDRCTCRCRGANHGLEHEQPPRCGVCGRLIVDQNAIPRPGGRAPRCRHCHRRSGLASYYRRRAAR